MPSFARNGPKNSEYSELLMGLGLERNDVVHLLSSEGTFWKIHAGKASRAIDY